MISILLSRRQPIQGNPEIRAVVRLLQLVGVAYRPIVEVAHYEHMLRRGRLARCVGTQRYLRLVCRVVVDTVQHACRTVRPLWCFGYAGAQRLPRRLRLSRADTFEHIIAFLTQRGRVGNLFPVAALHFFPVQQQTQFARLGRHRRNAYLRTFL